MIWLYCTIPGKHWHWNNKGLTLIRLASTLMPLGVLTRRKIWIHKMLIFGAIKGVAFSLLGWLKEALECFDMAIDIEPEEDMSTVESIAYLRTVLQWPGITKG